VQADAQLERGEGHNRLNAYVCAWPAATLPT